MWIHRSDSPFGVVTRDDIDARVMDLGETVASENSTWMGNRMGNVEIVCSKANQTKDIGQRMA